MGDGRGFLRLKVWMWVWDRVWARGKGVGRGILGALGFRAGWSLRGREGDG